MADSDKLRELENKQRELEALIRDIQRQIGNQPLRIANRQQGGGGIRWTEYTGP